MNKKQELLLGLEIVKNEHRKWADYAEAKFRGIDIDTELTPVKHTECTCGKMIAENGQVIYHLKTAHSLHKDHEEFHRIAEDLYHFMSNKNTGNFFTKAGVERKNREIMQNYADTLRNLSDNLIQTFNNIINEINCLDESKIEDMLSNPQ